MRVFQGITLGVVFFTACTIAVAETWTWSATALDAKTKTPVEGVAVEVTVTDISDGNKVLKNQCTTDTRGACKLSAKTSGGLFSTANITNTFSIEKSGYSKAFSVVERQISGSDYSVVFRMNSIGTGGGTKSYPIGEGPVIGTLVGLQPVAISDLFIEGAVASKVKGKFETDEAHAARVSNADRYLVSGRIFTTAKQGCLSTYEHSVQKYSIPACQIFTVGSAVLVVKSVGEPMVLSNAFDSRKVTRQLDNRYVFGNVESFSWSGSFQLSLKDAESFDGDLSAAVEIEGVSLQSECPSCKKRDSSDNIDGLLDSVATLQNRSSARIPGWKDEAFRSGSLQEIWIHTVSAKKVLRYFVYRASDQKVLFEMKVE